MVDEATTAAEEISIATQQQRRASDQVVVAMTQVSEVSGQYAAGSKQTAASSTEISSLATAMQESIAMFNVEREDTMDHVDEAVVEFSDAPQEPYDADLDRRGTLEISTSDFSVSGLLASRRQRGWRSTMKPATAWAPQMTNSPSGPMTRSRRSWRNSPQLTTASQLGSRPRRVRTRICQCPSWIRPLGSWNG